MNTLSKRIKGEDNFIVILKIYNKLIKFEAISFLKQSLIKLVMKSPEDIHTFDKETRREFEKCLNLQEILYSVINNQEVTFTRDFLVSHFPLSGMIDEIDNSLERLNEIEKEDDSYDAQDYDELRDYQCFDLIKIYVQVGSLKHHKSNLSI